MKVLPVDRKTRQTFERKKQQNNFQLHVLLHVFGKNVMKIKTICSYIEKSYGLSG
jgi:hypothetical protein